MKTLFQQMLYPGRLVLLSIMTMIAIGTILLSLPMAQEHHIPLIDIIFTAVSATSITGVFTVPIDAFTFFGKCVILLLMQIGGIGLVTLTLFSISLFVDLGMGAQQVAGEILEIESWNKTKDRLLFIISFTLIAELIGAVIFFFLFHQEFSLPKAVFLSIFHAVSSFCNVGISLFDNSLIAFKNNALFLWVTAALIFIGGFGFLTWLELFFALKAKRQQKRFALSLTTKISLWSNFILLFISCILLLFLEWHVGFLHVPLFTAISNVFFNAISYRSTGFTTLPINEIHYATLFLIMIFSFIGSSAGSTGSGIKQSTFAIFFATIRAAILNKSTVHIFGRRVPKDQILKAIAIISLSMSWIIIVTFALLLLETGHEFIDILFEVVSSFANLGLTTGITHHLSLQGKSLIIASMIIGRVGSLTLILALMRKHKKREFEYPEERVALS